MKKVIIYYYIKDGVNNILAAELEIGGVTHITTDINSSFSILGKVKFSVSKITIDDKSNVTRLCVNDYKNRYIKAEIEAEIIYEDIVPYGISSIDLQHEKFVEIFGRKPII